MMQLSDAGSVPVHVHGLNLDQDADYGALLLEIDRLGKVSSTGQGVDWKKVTVHAEAILRQKCKHLQVGVYLAVGLSRYEGMSGFIQGVGILSDLVNMYWETMLPSMTRKRGRLNAIQWWLEQARSYIKDFDSWSQVKPGMGDMLRQVCLHLQVGFDTHLGDDAPLLTDIVRFAGQLDEAVLENRADESAESEPELHETLSPAVTEGVAADKEQSLYENPVADQVHATATQASDADGTVLDKATPPYPESVSDADNQPAKLAMSESTSAALHQSNTSDSQDTVTPQVESLYGPVLSPRSSDEALRVAVAAVEQAFSIFAEQGSCNPLRFALLCQALWLPVYMLPQADDSGVTGLPAPDEASRIVVDRIIANTADQPADVLLSKLESTLLQHRFWFDAAYAMSLVLERMGDIYAPARQRFIRECSALVSEFSTLPNMCFSDGSPVALAETRQWLIELTQPSSLTSSEAAVIQQDKTSSSQMDMQTLHDRFAESVPVMPHESSSGQQRFMTLMQLCRTFRQSGYEDVCSGIGDEIFALLHTHSLNEWDPALALHGWMELAEMYGVQEGEAASERFQESLRQILRLNPSEALRLASMIASHRNMAR